MFEQVGLARDRCDYHGGMQLVVVLEEKGEWISGFGRQPGRQTRICEPCIRALGKWAEVLKRARLGAESQKPKASPTRRRKKAAGTTKEGTNA